MGFCGGIFITAHCYRAWLAFFSKYSPGKEIETYSKCRIPLPCMGCWGISTNINVIVVGHDCRISVIVFSKKKIEKHSKGS